MEFVKIDPETWPRREYFEHYFSAVPCTYSITVKLDITPIRARKQKLYPAMLYYLTTVVNRHPEFRTALDEAGQPGVFSRMNPSYTVFHPDTETFSELWTEYAEDYDAFLTAYEKDHLEYGSRQGMEGKPCPPKNIFTVSMLPWTSFEGFNLNLQRGYTYLLPIFTMGRYTEEGGRVTMPLAVQVHHAVCDGFHVSRFVRELQELIDNGGF